MDNVYEVTVTLTGDPDKLEAFLSDLETDAKYIGLEVNVGIFYEQ